MAERSRMKARFQCYSVHQAKGHGDAGYAEVRLRPVQDEEMDFFTEEPVEGDIGIVITDPTLHDAFTEGQVYRVSFVKE